MIQLKDLDLEMTEVLDSELGSVTGGGSYEGGYTTNPLTGQNTGNLGIGFGSTNFGYNFSNLNNKVLNETYSVKTQVSPGLSVGGSYDGVSKSVSGNLEYKTNGFSGSIFASPTDVGFKFNGNL
jgi:hypothetical protein